MPSATSGASRGPVRRRFRRAATSEPTIGASPRASHAERPSAATLFTLFGLAVLAAPTVLLIARASWTDEQSQQGPIVLAIGGWLLWRRWGEMRAVGQPGSLLLSLAAMTACGLAYVGGRLASLYLVEAYALYGFGVVAVYALVGWRGLARGFFPLVFLAFAAPVPFFVGFPVTTQLRLWITETTVSLLRDFGIGAARDGLTLFVENYRIEIAEACSGMNSLLALTALGLCYVHIRRDPRLGYYLVMLPIIVVFAVVANLARVLCLALLTLYAGDAVAQGLLHETLGFVTFAVALGLTFLADGGLARIWPAAVHVERS